MSGSPAHAGIDPSPRASLAATRRLPAHAGIDPVTSMPETMAWRLPRSRGDRPMTEFSEPTGFLAPPLTRGSTRSQCYSGERYPGSPAHAGIDPCNPSAASPRFRLPRSRGDRPNQPRPERHRHKAPPLTRGSTLAGARHPGRCHGSPAHAGIDPIHPAGRAKSLRLPRSRGDRPRASIHCPPTYKAPPLTRGSTPPIPARGGFPMAPPLTRGSTLRT